MPSLSVWLFQSHSWLTEFSFWKSLFYTCMQNEFSKLDFLWCPCLLAWMWALNFCMLFLQAVNVWASQLSVTQKVTVNVDGVLYFDTFNVVARSISPVLEFFNCPLHFEPPYCEMWNPTADKCYRLSVDEMHHSPISPHTIVYWRTYHPAMNWRYYPLTAFLKVNMWINAALLGSMAANCLSFPESIVSDYSLLDHWNVLCRLPEFLTAVSFITVNATVMSKHWFCCFHYLLFCPLLCLSKSHSVLMPLLCSSIVFPCCVGGIFSFRFTSASFI